MQCINAGVEIGFNCRIPFMDELLLPCRAYSLQSTGSSDSDEVMRSPNGTMLQSTYYVTDRKMAADNKFVTFGKSSIHTPLCSGSCMDSWYPRSNRSNCGSLCEVVRFGFFMQLVKRENTKKVSRTPMWSRFAWPRLLIRAWLGGQANTTCIQFQLTVQSGLLP